MLGWLRQMEQNRLWDTKESLYVWLCGIALISAVVNWCRWANTHVPTHKEAECGAFPWSVIKKLPWYGSTWHLNCINVLTGLNWFNSHTSVFLSHLAQCFFCRGLKHRKGGHPLFSWSLLHASRERISQHSRMRERAREKETERKRNRQRSRQILKYEAKMTQKQNKEITNKQKISHE